MGLIVELPVTFKNNRPTVPVEVDGHPVTALVDSGAYASLLFPETAKRLGIPTRVDNRFRAYGADGQAKSVSFAHASIGLMGAKGPPMDLEVIGAAPPGIDMLIGEDILSQAVLEMDLAKSKMRLLRPDHCQDEDMPYWAQSYSEAQVKDGPGHHIYLTVLLNGARVPAILDSGAAGSLATERAAFSAGVTLPPPTGKATSRGVNGVRFETRWGTVASVQVGDEKIGSTRMRFGPLYTYEEASDTGSRTATNEPREMLLGADFLRSHHVIIDRDRGKMFFTYNGGPVFLPDAPPTAPDTGIHR